MKRLETVALKLRSLAAVQGGPLGSALMEIAAELADPPAPTAPTAPTERLYQFSVNRIAFALVSVRATDVDDAREKAMVEAMNMSEAAWSLDPEIEIDGMVNSKGEIDVCASTT